MMDRDVDEASDLAVDAPKDRPELSLGGADGFDHDTRAVERAALAH
jgi:hypothetical protein